MCLDLSWDVSVASAEVRMSLSSPKQSQRGCWRTLSPGPATAQHGNFDDEMKSAEAVKSWFDIFCENCEIDWHTNSIVENHIHHIRSRSFYCVKSQCLLRSRVYFISIPDAVIIEVQVGPRRTVHVQFASHTLHQFENQFECRMKWYEMIWNEWNDMKWKKSSYARIPRCPKSMMWHSVTLCAEKCAGAGTGFHGAANYGPDALDAELKSDNLQFSLTWTVCQFVGPKEYQENPREA